MIVNVRQPRFHYGLDIGQLRAALLGDRTDTSFTYRFENFFHPYVGRLIEQLNKKSIAGLLDPDFHAGLRKPFFETFYIPLESETVKLDYFDEDIDLSEG